MAGVVGYWQLPEEERQFLAFVEGTGDILAVPTYWAETRAEMAPERITSFIDRLDPGDLYFGPSELQWDIEARHFGDKLLFGVSQMMSCVVGYDRGRLRDGEITLSNLSVYWDYPSKDGSQIVRKSELFVKWSKRILDWVRRRTTERVECNGYPYRATKRVKDAVNNGKLRAVLY
jgi:hypothetical protein